MESLKEKINHLVHTNDKIGLQDLQDELDGVLTFSRREVARTLIEKANHDRNVGQCEANIKQVQIALEKLLAEKK